MQREKDLPGAGFNGGGIASPVRGVDASDGNSDGRSGSGDGLHLHSGREQQTSVVSVALERTD